MQSTCSNLISRDFVHTPFHNDYCFSFVKTLSSLILQLTPVLHTVNNLTPKGSNLFYKLKYVLPVIHFVNIFCSWFILKIIALPRSGWFISPK